MKQQSKSTGKVLNEMEKSECLDKEFKIMVIKMLTELHETHKREEWRNTERQQRDRTIRKYPIAVTELKNN